MIRADSEALADLLAYDPKEKYDAIPEDTKDPGLMKAKKALKKSRKAGPIGEIMSSRSFLVDVHLLRRD